MVQISSAEDSIVGKYIQQFLRLPSAPKGPAGVKAGHIQQHIAVVILGAEGNGDTPGGKDFRGIPDGGSASGAIQGSGQHGNTSFLPDYAAEDTPVLDFFAGSGIMKKKEDKLLFTVFKRTSSLL